MQIDKNTTFKELLIILDAFAIRGDKLSEMVTQIEQHPTPTHICGVAVPSDLNDLTIGELIHLQSIKGDNIFEPIEIITNLRAEMLYKVKAFDVIAYVAMIRNEVERINKLFESVKHKPTAEERQAGIEGINSGAFGILDWYARRMGIVDHEAVEYVPWVRIYKCMEIDFQNSKFERRLRDIYAKKR